MTDAPEPPPVSFAELCPDVAPAELAASAVADGDDGDDEHADEHAADGHGQYGPNRGRISCDDAPIGCWRHAAGSLHSQIRPPHRA